MNWKAVKPTLVLTVISLVIAGLLSATYQLAGIGNLGKSLSKEDLAACQPVVLPDAAELVFHDTTVEDENLLGVYKDTAGNGVALHVMAKGYHKDGMKLMVGIDMEGKVTGVSVLASMETNGIGTKTALPEFLNQFIGKSGTLVVAKDGTGDIDAVANATVSSKGVTNGVNLALSLFEQVKEELQ